MWDKELEAITSDCDIISIDELITEDDKNGDSKTSVFFGQLCDEIEDGDCIAPDPVEIFMSGEIKYGKASKKTGGLEGEICVSGFKTTC